MLVRDGSLLTLQTAEVFVPLIGPRRYKVAHGGRGSGKSHFFAELAVAETNAVPGTRMVCIREYQKSLMQSSKQLIESKLRDAGLGLLFDVKRPEISTPGGGLIIFTGMQDHNAETIKSLEGCRIAWVEEAQTLSARSWSLLRPTIRLPGSEIWCSYNRTRKRDAVDEFFTGLQAAGDPDLAMVKANWRDNPWWNQTLESERQRDLKLYPERYEHIWEGDYAKAFEGAYYARQLAQAQLEGRITKLAVDPLLPVRAFFDLGGAGAKADAMAIWIVQFVAKEIRLLDYVEGVGQPLGYYVETLRDRGWKKLMVIVPHDGLNTNNITGKRYWEHMADVEGWDVQPPIENQGPGAAAQRIEAARRVFAACWFDPRTEPGRDALGYYHERKDEQRGVGLGPEHDWSSHCFTGDTEVLTRYGTYRIMDLPESGEVLTPCGWKQYRNPRVTRRDAPLVEVRFTDGLTVKCTPDHMFLTANGWTSAQRLPRGSLIQSTLMALPSISMAGFTECGPAGSTQRVAVGSFIEMCGKRLSDLCQRIATSITATATFTTLCFQTSNVYRPKNISKRPGSANLAASVMKHAARLRNGTRPQKADFGTAATPSAPKAGRSGNASQPSAWSAAASLMRWFARMGARKSIAAALARLRLIGTASACGPPTIASVKRLSETSDVWCLTVPDGECFSLANGAVVHNCADAFGLMAVVYEEPTVNRERKRVAARGGWMGA